MPVGDGRYISEKLNSALPGCGRLIWWCVALTPSTHEPHSGSRYCPPGGKQRRHIPLSRYRLLDAGCWPPRGGNVVPRCGASPGRVVFPLGGRSHDARCGWSGRRPAPPVQCAAWHRWAGNSSESISAHTRVPGIGCDHVRPDLPGLPRGRGPGRRLCRRRPGPAACRPGGTRPASSRIGPVSVHSRRHTRHWDGASCSSQLTDEHIWHVVNYIRTLEE